MSISRRELMVGTAALGMSSLLSPLEAAVRNKASKFRFVVISDLHIQPELGAADGVQLAVKKILSLHPRPAFVIVGGDHVMDVLKVSRERADLQFKLLKEALKPLDMPVYSVVGNHDVYGWGNKDFDQADPAYGKKLIEEKFLGERAYRSFDFGGWHFTLLDSIQTDKSRGWRGAIDDDQLTWLKDDLAKAGNAPKVIVTHVPAMSLIAQYTEGTMAQPNDGTILANGKDIYSLAHQFGVKAVFQGHTHVVENCDYAGTQYITAGAICGEWWKGPRLGIHPEGFMVVDVSGQALKSEYVSYGWTARA